ncbi:DNA-binding SARP family transcriptional activator/tetratricopeptide (TPR) repeat protein [Streptomyces sp. V4I8]|uniref:BTAD domain-containing putative transcriptional regulator n=1 Tax=Streptomyces sp. V4I8 TaxID=3156469 RepID=UPI0035118CE7
MANGVPFRCRSDGAKSTHDSRVDSVVERGHGRGPAAREGSGGVKRYELRFGLLGPPVVFEGSAEGADRSDSSEDSSYDAQGPGQVAADASDRAVRIIGSPKVRALFAALLLEGGRVVSVESLTDALWGGAPPASARASLHNHVARLRRLLDDPERLRAVPPGYVLRVDEGELDVDLFVSRVATARAAHAARDWERTVRACTEALALWRGTPLAGLPAEVGGYALVQRLKEARLLLLEWRYDAELTTAGPRLDALVPELAALAAEHPLRESFHRHLMLALHHTGRRAEALAIHRDLRSRLIEELGVEPGAGVREAHVEVLRGGGDGGSGGGRGVWGAVAGGAGREVRGAAGGGVGRALRVTSEGSVDREVRGGAEGGVGPALRVTRGAAEGEVGRALPMTSEEAADREVPGAAQGGVDRELRAVAEASVGRAGDVVHGRVGTAARHEDDLPDGAAHPDATRDDDVLRRPAPADAVREAGPSPAPPLRESDLRSDSAPARREGGAVTVPVPSESAAHPVPAPSESAAHPDPAPSESAAHPASTPRAADAEASVSSAPSESAPDPAPVLAPASAAPALRAPDTSAAPAPQESTTSATPPLRESAPPTTPPAPATSLQDAASRPPRPAQLPPPPAHFTGRTAVLHDLRHTLAPDPAPERQRPRPAVVVISGMAGVGKSALALEVSHGLANRFPDGQLYVNLHGATPGMPPLTPGQALTALLRDLGADPRSIPEHSDAAAALLRSLLAPTRTLMVLDDAANAAQVRPLLPAAPGCAVIVTSRSPLTALDGVRRFPLKPLPAEDSAALLRAASGRGTRDGHAATDRTADIEGPSTRVGSEGPSTRAGGQAPATCATREAPATAAADHGIDAVHPLIALTGGLPLALRVVAARLAARSALTPDVLARQLAATEGRLHHLEYDDLSVRRSLAVAHDALAASDREADRDAALALRRIGALDLPTYGAPLLARLTDTDERRAEAALDRLVDVALLEETAYGRYAPHDLVRDFARELAEGDGDFTETALRWYAAVAERTLTAIVEPGLDRDDRRRPTPTQAPDHAQAVDAVAAFDTPEAAYAWGNLELENIVTLAERHTGDDSDQNDPDRAKHPTTTTATGAKHSTIAPATTTASTTTATTTATTIPSLLCTLIRLLFPYLQRSGHVAEMELLGGAALRVARRLGDEAAEAYALGDLAGLHFLTGRQSEALHLNDRALTIWRRLAVVSWMRRCLNNRGLLLEGLGRYPESGQALRQSLEYSRQLNDPHGEAVTYSHLGNLYEHTDPRAAIEQHRRSLAIGDEIGNIIVQHSAHCNIGYAHLTLGEPAAAATHFEESLRILGGHGDCHGESQTRLGLVRALRLLGHTDRATHACAELLTRADARADRYTAGLARHQKGLLLAARGRVQDAHTEWRTALDLLDGTDATAVVQELRHLRHDPAADLP